MTRADGRAAHPCSSTRRAARGEGKRTKGLRSSVLEVLDSYSGPMSGRQVYYQLVSGGDVENSSKSCKAVLRLLVKMRRDGSIPYSRIVDRTRAVHKRPGWDGVAHIMENVAQQYRRDFWADQAVVPMIACEKAALEGIFAAAVDEYGASLWTLRGFNSESFEYEWSEEIKAITAEEKQVVIYYFGDWDPSGLAIEENSKRKLAGFGAGFEWRRAGLLAEDFDRFEIVPVPVKRTDTRSKAFLSKFGPRAAELDALSPKELHRRITNSITAYIDTERWGALQRTEANERAGLVAVVKNWDAAVAAAGAA